MQRRLFLLYRFLIRSIGVERLGVWSLVLATTSVVTLANQGFASSIVKFVAQYCARGRRKGLRRGGNSADHSRRAAHGDLRRALSHRALDSAAGDSAGARRSGFAILPYALASLWINVLGSVLLAALAGHELMSHRNYVVAGGSFLYLVLAFAMVPRWGLVGMAYAQTIQTAACFMTAWILLRQQLPDLATRRTQLGPLAVSGDAGLWAAIPIHHHGASRPRTRHQSAARKIRGPRLHRLL